MLVLVFLPPQGYELLLVIIFQLSSQLLKLCEIYCDRLLPFPVAWVPCKHHVDGVWPLNCGHLTVIFKQILVRVNGGYAWPLFDVESFLLLFKCILAALVLLSVVIA